MKMYNNYKIHDENKVEIITVIKTYLELRGNGKDDPFRRITQYWTLDGKLLAEKDINKESL